MAKYKKLLVYVAVLATLLVSPRFTRAATLNPSNGELIAYMHEVFGPEMPHFYQIIKCESTFRQWERDGLPLISYTTDIGISQINLWTWGSEARKLGLDIFNSWQDNIKMAHYIYGKQGFKAWVCYKKITQYYLLHL